MGQLSFVDHAYIHRLETGEKESPSTDTFERILRVLKPDVRESEMAKWLADHPKADPDVVAFAFNDATVSLEVFTAAAATFHRGTKRPDPATLIDRVKRAFGDA
jgi:hypothetical protein